MSVIDTYYYDQRWYDAPTGQFMSADPIEFDTHNLYRYVGNNPTNATDPTGLQERVLPGDIEMHLKDNKPMTLTFNKFRTGRSKQDFVKAMAEVTGYQRDPWLSDAELTQFFKEQAMSYARIKMRAELVNEKGEPAGPWGVHVHAFDQGNKGERNDIEKRFARKLAQHGFVADFKTAVHHDFEVKAMQKTNNEVMKKAPFVLGFIAAPVVGPALVAGAAPGTTATGLLTHGTIRLTTGFARSGAAYTSELYAGASTTAKLWKYKAGAYVTANALIFRGLFDDGAPGGLAWEGAGTSGRKIAGEAADETVSAGRRLWMHFFSKAGDEAAEGVNKFRGPAAKGFDWKHIFDRHSEVGDIAAQRARPEQIFSGLSETDIKSVVTAAWRSRKKLQTQTGVDNVTRILYEGADAAGRRVHLWFNSSTKIVETAYPVNW